MKKETLIYLSLALFALLYFGGSWLYNTTNNVVSNEKNSALVRDYAPSLGKANAKTVIVEFFDPACETCKAFYPFVKNIMKAHPDKIKLVMRHAPFHADSYYVVQMLEASKYQNRYFETLETLYAYQDKWTINHKVNIAPIWGFLQEAGLDIEKLRDDMKRPEVDERIKQDIADTKTLGITKTPEFIVNGKPLKRFGYKELEELIASEL